MKNIFCTIILLVISCLASQAQQSGPYYPTTYSTTGTGLSAGWGNLMGIQFVDNNPAYVDLAQYPTCNNFMCYYSNTAVFTGFGFAVPSGATITGIEVEILQRVNSPGGGIHDSILVLSLNGNPMGNNKAATGFNWYDVPTPAFYGDSADTWGYSWTPSDVNDPTFGLQYLITNTSYDQTASVDRLLMTVYYQTGSGMSYQTSSPLCIGVNNNCLQISGESSLFNEGGTVRVTSMNGNLVHETILLAGNQTINFNLNASAWANGIYTVTIDLKSGKSIQRKVALSK
jgi:hypothetical protein